MCAICTEIFCYYNSYLCSSEFLFFYRWHHFLLLPASSLFLTIPPPPSLPPPPDYVICGWIPRRGKLPHFGDHPPCHRAGTGKCFFPPKNLFEVRFHSPHPFLFPPPSHTHTHSHIHPIYGFLLTQQIFKFFCKFIKNLARHSNVNDFHAEDVSTWTNNDFRPQDVVEGLYLNKSH